MSKRWAVLGIVAILVLAVAAYYFTGQPTDPTATTTTSATSSATTAAGETGAADDATVGSTATTAASSATTAAAGDAVTQTAAASVREVPRPDDHVMGSPDAPVTIIEYASLTCPHCAAFHRETMPRIKSEFVDKGLVRVVFRDFPLNRPALQATLLARCGPPESYFNMLDVLFRTQQDWSTAADPVQALKGIGAAAGLTDEAMSACLADGNPAIETIVENMTDAQARYEVSSTPSFIIQGKKYAGALPFDDYDDAGTMKPGMSRIITDLLPKP